jgi:hypothetical protein
VALPGGADWFSPVAVGGRRHLGRIKNAAGSFKALELPTTMIQSEGPLLPSRFVLF